MKNPRAVLVGSILASFIVGASLGSAFMALVNTPSAASNTQLDARYPLATNASQLKFFKAAVASCDAAKADGVVMQMADSTTVILKADSTGVFTEYKVDSTDSYSVGGTYSDSGPTICDPAFSNQQAITAIKFNNKLGVANEFLLEDNGDGNYSWHAHYGSQEVSNQDFTVTNGKFSQVNDLQGASPMFTKSITYGLSADQAAAIAKLATN
jgi:hypothetical protein